MKTVEVMAGNVTSPKGFLASGVAIGLKKSQKKDLMLIYSPDKAAGAAVFTTNQACAAPVIVSREHVKNHQIQAIVINSGNANACTGQQGIEDAATMAALVSQQLNIPIENVIVGSTGVIGVPMPMELVEKGVPLAAAALSPEGGQDAAEAIMTTDLVSKTLAVVTEIDGKTITLGGIAKGSGMIHPNMATMLSLITTDALVEGAYLQKLLKEIADETFNMITVDGDTSTNDMVAVMANGAAGNRLITEAHPEASKFREALYYVNEYLAKAIVRDGEGATKFLEARVINSSTVEAARQVAKSILGSSLVKTAFFGEDGNWGRILCSIGYSGIPFRMEQIEISLSSAAGTVQIVKGGQGTGFLEEDVDRIIKETDIQILVDLKAGEAEATGWGCDLSYDYVKINGAYRT